jgi:flagellar hook protein FlgE
MSFRTAVTGLNAATSDLGVISNNIANSNTTGFKPSRAEFADLFYNATAVGSGTKLSGVNQQFAQGSLTETGNPLDMAVSGEGFFRLNDNGSNVYTRAGTFGVDREGYIVNRQGMNLTGRLADSTGNVTNKIGNLQLKNTPLEPQATSRVELGLNLAADAPAIDNTLFPFDPTNSDTYNYSTSVAINDSQGISHTLSAYFVKPNAAVNDWTVNFTLDGTAIAGSSTLSFNQAGAIDPTTATINLTGIASGNAAANMDLTLDFNDTTQFGGQFSTQDLIQDGFASGSLTSVEVGDDGTVFGRYSNGQARPMGQVVLANFSNTEGLTPIGDTGWAESFASGSPLVDAPGTGKLGLITAASLESSNVDITKELVGMINAQRNFQANAQVISTNDQMSQTLLNMR